MRKLFVCLLIICSASVLSKTVIYKARVEKPTNHTPVYTFFIESCVSGEGCKYSEAKAGAYSDEIKSYPDDAVVKIYKIKSTSTNYFGHGCEAIYTPISKIWGYLAGDYPACVAHKD